jgi:hypothetical protein
MRLAVKAGATNFQKYLRIMRQRDDCVGDRFERNPLSRGQLASFRKERN